ISSVGDDDGVGPLIDDCLAALRENTASRLTPPSGSPTTASSRPLPWLSTEQLKHLLGSSVTHTDISSTRRRQFFQLRLRGQLLAFALSNFSSRGHHQHIAYLTLVQSLGLQYQTKRLIPGYIIQAQRNASLNRITCHQVQFCEISDNLQYSTNFNILKIE